MNRSSFWVNARKYFLPIAFTILGLYGMFASLILRGEFQAWGIKQQAFILLTVGLALLFWDYTFFRRSLLVPKISVYLVWACLGLILLPLILIFPFGLIFQRRAAETLPNIFVLLGLAALFRSAYLRFSPQEESQTSAKLLWLMALVGLTSWLSPGLFNYLLVCLTSLFVGRGLSRLLGLSALNRRSLTPFLTLVFWSILIGFGAGVGIPMKIGSILIWTLSIGLAWLGIKQQEDKPLFERTDMLVMLIPLLVALPYTIYGFSNYVGNPSVDSWNYIAGGQALWEMNRCTTDVVIPFYRFALALSCATRYISFGFLGLLSSLSGVPGDTQMSVGIYIPWVFFVYASTLRFFAESRKEADHIINIYIVLGALAGWPLVLMFASNFDNLLMITYLPAISGLALLGNFSLRWNVLMGIIGAAILYTYPELSPFVFLAIGFLIIERCHILRLRFSKALSTIGIIIVVGLLAASPYLQGAFAFLISQFKTVYTTPEGQPLPGGPFATLLVDPHYWFVALWGSPIGHISKLLDALRLTVSFSFLLFFLFGVAALWYKKEFGLLATLAFFALSTAYYLIIRQYGYAGYKLLNIAWWLIAYVILTGCLKIFKRLDLRSKNRQWVIGVLACIYLVWCFTTWQNLPSLRIKQIIPYRAIASISIPEDETLLVSVHDAQAALWASYYLRNKPVIYIIMSERLIPYVSEVDATFTHRGSYILIDRSTPHRNLGKLVWENSVYKLVKLSKARSAFEQIDHHDDLEGLDGNFIFWSGSSASMSVRR